MICDEYNCPYMKRSPVLGIGTSCLIYPIVGQAFRDRMGYCPIIDDGPNRKTTKVTVKKKRWGQGKTKQGGNR